MRFSVECPVDGQVTVGIAEIASVVVRESDVVDVVFSCPVCGSHIHVSAQVPRALLASLEEAMPRDDVDGERRLRFIAQIGLEPDGTGPAEPAGEIDQARIDAYCEYFRRQLESVSTAEAMLAEIDTD